MIIPIGNVTGTQIASFVIWGEPQPQGSKSSFAVYRKGPGGAREWTGKTGMKEGNEKALMTWRGSVKDVVGLLLRPDGDTLDGYPIDQAVYARMVFSFARPKSHWRSGRNAHLLSDRAPRRVTSKPDLSKLLRSTEDALTDVGFWRDDALVTDYRDPGGAAKVWCGEDPEALDVPGARLTFWLAPTIAAPTVMDEGRLPAQLTIL